MTGYRSMPGELPGRGDTSGDLGVAPERVAWRDAGSNDWGDGWRDGWFDDGSVGWRNGWFDDGNDGGFDDGAPTPSGRGAPAGGGAKPMTVCGRCVRPPPFDPGTPSFEALPLELGTPNFGALPGRVATGT